MLSFSDLDTYSLVLKVCRRYGVDPSASIESDQFFSDLLNQYKGPTDKGSITTWLTEQIKQHFVALRYRPRWIQGAEWPFANGVPMIFAGQIDLTLKVREKVTPTLYHDDTSLYVFVAPMVEPVVILQQF